MFSGLRRAPAERHLEDHLLVAVRASFQSAAKVEVSLP